MSEYQRLLHYYQTLKTKARKITVHSTYFKRCDICKDNFWLFLTFGFNFTTLKVACYLVLLGLPSTIMVLSVVETVQGLVETCTVRGLLPITTNTITSMQTTPPWGALSWRVIHTTFQSIMKIEKQTLSAKRSAVPRKLDNIPLPHRQAQEQCCYLIFHCSLKLI